MSQSSLQLPKEFNNKNVLFSSPFDFICADNKVKQYTIIVTEFRMFLLKQRKFRGFATHQNLPLTSLHQLAFGPHSETSNFLLFLNFDTEIIHNIIFSSLEESRELLETLTNSINKLQNVCPRFKPLVNLVIDDHIRREETKLTPSQRLEKCYELLCDLSDKPKSAAVVNRIGNFTNGLFDLEELFGDQNDHKGISVTTEEMRIFGNLIKECSDFFTEVAVRNIQLTDDGFSIFVGKALQNENLRSLTMTDCKVTCGSCMLGIVNGWGELHPNLTHLDLSNNPKIGDAGIEHLAKVIGESKLERLNLSSCGFSYKAVQSLAIAANSKYLSSSLKNFDISNNILRKKGSIKISACIQNLRFLERLNLSGTDASIEDIISGLKFCYEKGIKKIRELDLSHCKMNQKGIVSLSELMEKNESLRRLNLSGTKMGFDDLEILYQGITRNVDSRIGEIGLSLDLSENDFEVMKNVVFGNINRSIKSIDLSSCNMRTQTLLRMIPQLQNLRRLHTLKLNRSVYLTRFSSGNEAIGSALAELSFNSPHLQYLSLNGGTSDNENAKNTFNPLLDSLSTNKSLKWLLLTKNRMANDEFVHLTEGIKKNSSLRGIDVEMNKVNIVKMTEFLVEMSHNKDLIESVPVNEVETLSTTKNLEILLKLKVANDNAIARLEANRKRLLATTEHFDIEEFEYGGKEIEDDVVENRLISLGPQFGVNLEDLVGFTVVSNLPSAVPTILLEMAEYFFRNEGHLVVGAFRLAPDNKEFSSVKNQLNSNSFVECVDINCIAKSIKQWFRDLPDPLLPMNLLDMMERIIKSSGGNSDDEAMWQSVIEIALKPISENGILDDRRIAILLWISALSAEVSRYSHKNKMGISNMSIVIAPNLFNPNVLHDMKFSELGRKFFGQLVKCRLEDESYKESLGFEYEGMNNVIEEE